MTAKGGIQPFYEEGVQLKLMSEGLGK
jgi:hypothetical protein